MSIYVFGQQGISPVDPTTFDQVGIRERQDIQRLLRDHVEVIAPDTLVISEEFGEWDESRRRIDLLGIDKSANLVVIELKRTQDGGHMELQAIRYASLVSTMTFDQAVSALERHFVSCKNETDDARETILRFLNWDDQNDELFGQNVRIVLASAEFSKELTTSVLWLIDQGLDIRCVRLKPYSLDGKLVVDIQQIIPLPEVQEYVIQVQNKSRREREARVSGADFTRYDVQIAGEAHPSMWKRQAIFLICKRLCERGVRPEEIANLFTWRLSRTWYSLDGILSSAEFIQRAAQATSSNGAKFEPRRWFCVDGQLVHVDGRTYAFSTQWGREGWEKAMTLVQQKYPELRISFSPAN